MDEQLKQRLVGAAVLVGLAVIFVPMLLRPPAQELAAEPEDAPSESSRPVFSSRVVPLEKSDPEPELAPVRIEPSRASSGPQPAPPVRLAPVRPAGDEVRAPAPVSPPASPEVTGRVGGDVARDVGGWMVQLGSFSNAGNAASLTDRLRAKGYEASARAGSSARGRVTRVYVGPFPSREAARRAVEPLERETRLRGIVIRAGG
jgi:DedD protein